MSEETPTGDGAGKTFTQDDVDRIVADRLRREREKVADYDDLKAKAETVDDLQKQLEDATGKVSDLEPRLSRLQVAMDKQLPSALADRLRGETDEELAEDADRLLELVAPPDPPKAGDPKPDPAQGKNRDGTPGLNEDRLLTDLKNRLGVS